MIGKSVLPALTALLLVSGCTVGPKYVRPEVSSPASLVGPNAPTPATPLSKVTETDADLTDWWSQFNDPILNELVARARSGNLDRKTAASRVREARESAAQARSALFPSVTAGGNYYHARLSENATPSGLSSSLGGGGSGAGGASAGSSAIETNIYVLGLQGAYTVDLFGANRSALRAARERADAEVWSARDTEITVTSEVARAYFALRAAQARLAVLQANAKSQGDLLAILVARSRGGLVNEVDTARQRSQLALIQAQIPPVEAEVAADAHQIGLLLGLPPDVLDADLAPRPDPLVGLPAVPPHVPIGLPSTLLKRRPDIRSAERQLAASVADVDQATAQLYPQIRLTGIVDLVSSSLKNLIESGSRTLIGGATLSQPLFDGGSRLAQKRQTEERSVQADLAYQKAVLTAFQQTADALARYAADQREIAVLQAGYAEGRRAAELERAQYLGGLTNLSSTLQAQTTALQAQDQLAQAQGQLFADLVQLYRSLGGGWNATERTAEERPALSTASSRQKPDDLR